MIVLILLQLLIFMIAALYVEFCILKNNTKYLFKSIYLYFEFFNTCTADGPHR